MPTAMIFTSGVIAGLIVATIYHKKFSRLAKDAKELADNLKNKLGG